MGGVLDSELETHGRQLPRFLRDQCGGDWQAFGSIDLRGWPIPLAKRNGLKLSAGSLINQAPG